MPDQPPSLDELLEAILADELDEVEAARRHPEFAAALGERIARLRLLDRELEEILPSGDGGERRPARVELAPRLPSIPGYRIDSVIGCGGMGVVYRAHHLALQRTVAIKMLLAGGYAHASELERFRREAEAIAALRSPNIVQVFDAGECDGHPYFVMEFVEGGSLAESLAGHPRPAREAAAMVVTLARAVHGAHRSGVSHRDLKPSNILLTSDGTPKVADFGLAQRDHHGESSAALTLPGARLGTPSYMSPEQASGAILKFCPLVDIYSLGAILYELLTGRPPFRGETSAETQRQVIADEPVWPMRLNPRTPRDLQTICLTCLQKDPSRRYASAADLADDLDRFLADAPIRARPIGGVERAWRWGRRRPATVALIVTLGVFGGAALGTGLWIARDLERRQSETMLREQLAREAVAAAIDRAPQLRRERRWAEAESMLAAGRSRLGEAKDAALAERLGRIEREVAVARDLDAVRHQYASPGLAGYDYGHAEAAYRQLFESVGLASTTPADEAIERIRSSPLREELLAALDQHAFVCRVIGLRERLAESLELARRADPDPWRDRFRDPNAWFDRASLLRLAADAREAGSTARSHQLVLVGVLLTGFGASEETIAPLRDAQRRDPSDYWVNLELANALRGAGRGSEAIEYLRAAIAIRPDNYVAWTTLGAIQHEVGQRQQAIDSLSKAIELNPGFPTSLFLLVQRLTEAGREDEALAVCDRSLPLLDANHAGDRIARSVHVLHGRLLASFRRWSEARDAYAVAGDRPVGVDTTEVLFERTAVALLADDRESYARGCAELLARMRREEARRYLVVRAFTLRPWSAEDRAEAFARGREELRENATAHWALAQMGLIALREGSLGEVWAPLAACVQAQPAPERTAAATVAQALLRRAEGRGAEADAIVAPIRTWFERLASRKPPGGTMHLHDWLEANALFREFDRGE